MHFEGHNVGSDPGFSFRGGGGEAQKIMCAHAHHERETRGPGEALGVLMLSRAIWALFFKHSDTNGKKTHSRSF